MKINGLSSRGVRRSGRRGDLFNVRLPRSLWSLAMTLLILLFLIPNSAHADHGGIHIIDNINTPPGFTCQYDRNPDECRKAICPQSPVPRICEQGKCITETNPRGIPSQENLPCNYTLDDLVLSGINVANVIFGFTASLMLMFIAYGGYQMLTSVGNPEGVMAGRKTLTAAFIGVILIFAATILVRFVAGLILPGHGQPGATISEPDGGGLPKIIVE